MHGIERVTVNGVEVAVAVEPESAPMPAGVEAFAICCKQFPSGLVVVSRVLSGRKRNGAIRRAVADMRGGSGVFGIYPHPA